jgi:hypothetical protein
MPVVLLRCGPPTTRQTTASTRIGVARGSAPQRGQRDQWRSSALGEHELDGVLYLLAGSVSTGRHRVGQRIPRLYAPKGPHRIDHVKLTRSRLVEPHKGLLQWRVGLNSNGPCLHGVRFNRLFVTGPLTHTGLSVALLPSPQRHGVARRLIVGQARCAALPHACSAPTRPLTEPATDR